MADMKNQGTKMLNKTPKTNGKTAALALASLVLLGAIFVLSTGRTGEETGKAVQTQIENNASTKMSHILLKVDIPCSGHAQLISDGLKNISGVSGVQYTEPDKFRVEYDPSKTNAKDILSLDLFREYPAVAQMSAYLIS
jgi:hypothetical protein